MRLPTERKASLSLLLALGLTACTSNSATGGGRSPAPDATMLPDAEAAGGALFMSMMDDACTSTQEISPSNFDQSCTSDLDCVAVGQGSVCLPCGLLCASAAINKNASAAYRAAIESAAGGPLPVTFCGCPNFGTPCCRHGQCSGTCDNEITDLDACAAAGGTCIPYASWLDGGSGCVRISFCAAELNPLPPTFSVCCPTSAVGDEGGGD